MTVKISRFSDITPENYESKQYSFAHFRELRNALDPDYNNTLREDEFNRIKDHLLYVGKPFEKLVKCKCLDLDPDYTDDDYEDYDNDDKYRLLQSAVAAAVSELGERISPEFAIAIEKLYWSERSAERALQRESEERALRRESEEQAAKKVRSKRRGRVR